MDETRMPPWAHTLLEERLADASRRLKKFRKNPKSAKRVHNMRKSLTRLHGAILDLGAEGPAAVASFANVEALHRRAGKVRDADVLLKRLREYAKSATAPERTEAKCVARALRKKRKKARRKLRKLVARIGTLRL